MPKLSGSDTRQMFKPTAKLGGVLKGKAGGDVLNRAWAIGQQAFGFKQKALLHVLTGGRASYSADGFHQMVDRHAQHRGVGLHLLAFPVMALDQ